MNPEKPAVLFTEEVIRRRVAEMARRISSDYADVEELLLVGILRGCFIFLADLSRLLTIDDVVDTGHTLQYLINALKPRGPASLKTCVFLRKRERFKTDCEIDYLGFDIPDLWVVGYGLDYADQHRTLPYVGSVSGAATR